MTEYDTILGQIYVAFGKGAGRARVSRATIAAIRDRWLPTIEANAAQWEVGDTAQQVLAQVELLGQLAAHLAAVEAGDLTIEPEDLARAVERKQSGRAVTVYC